MIITMPRDIRRKLGLVLGVIGLMVQIAGFAIGYIDMSLRGLFVVFTGQAIILQERRRLG